ncbi:MAG: PKD domain-containing protein [Candidatus Aminicenantes bacterium]|jgi:PKD repeat protein
MKYIKGDTGTQKAISVFSFIGIFLMLSTSLFSAITYTPNRPNVEQRVNFTVSGAVGLPDPVTWNFGDGTVVVDDANISHTYFSEGTYLVTATFGGETDSVQITITEERTIVYNPRSPKPGQTITFTARNFLSNSVRWDFGDGTVVTAGRQQTHVYSTGGTFSVIALDFGGSSQIPITTTVQLAQDPPEITFTPQIPRINEQVRFVARNFISQTLIRWDFGDGIIINDRTPPDITHTYNQPGYYQVKAYDDGGEVVTASVTVGVAPNPRIIFSPGDPRPGEDIDFEARFFFSNTLIRWDFGDGTIINDTSPPRISHSYAVPGTYQVRAYDNGQNRVTSSISVNVLPRRRITFAPPQPKAGQEVTFQAQYFSSSSIRWDFGDGTAITTEGNIVKHTYEREGVYAVRASDYRGVAEIVQTLSLTVFPQSGPRALFAISYINLRFADGKSYKVVPRGFEGFLAEADIKYEGTGNLLVQWVVDGIPFRTDSKSLTFAFEDTIDSGKIPGLPTLVPGIHEVTLRFIQPQVDFDIPVIRYYVTPEESKKPPVLIAITRAMDSQQQEIRLSGNNLEAPPGGYILFAGIFTNEDERTFRKSLLRIYIDSDVVDQQIITDLKPSETQPFQTSIYYRLAEPKILYFILYDITEEPAVLLSIKEINVSPKE